jgi:prefoldin subunit 5
MPETEMEMLVQRVTNLERLISGDQSIDIAGLRQRVNTLEDCVKEMQSLIRDLKTMVRTATVLVVLLGGGNLLATVLQLAGVVLFK